MVLAKHKRLVRIVSQNKANVILSLVIVIDILRTFTIKGKAMVLLNLRMMI